ncbi:MAG: Rrf2 family transcriptional regulator [Treponema sp.]|nr:Rrf2 family transcriptional regulator [Treponema sp.]
MKISTKGRYALRMLLDLAENRYNGFIALKEIAERQNISKQYLEQIITIISNSRILRANRGKQGGYMLAKEPSEISVGYILRITEGNISSTTCLESEINECKMADSCKTLFVWKELNKVIADYLDSVTLQDILDKYQEQQGDFYII